MNWAFPHTAATIKKPHGSSPKVYSLPALNTKPSEANGFLRPPSSYYTIKGLPQARQTPATESSQCSTGHRNTLTLHKPYKTLLSLSVTSFSLLSNSQSIPTKKPKLYLPSLRWCTWLEATLNAKLESRQQTTDSPPPNSEAYPHPG